MTVSMSLRDMGLFEVSISSRIVLMYGVVLGHDSFHSNLQTIGMNFLLQSFLFCFISDTLSSWNRSLGNSTESSAISGFS